MTIADNYQFELFTKATSPNLLEAYLRLKYLVFVREQGWFSLPHSNENEMAYPDAFDTQSIFILAQGPDTAPAGIARATMPPGPLPHMDLLDRHLCAPELEPLREQTATVNAVAVLKKFRGKIIAFQGDNFTVGQVMVAILLGYLEKVGMRVVLLSSDPKTGARFFTRLGFYALDKPFQYGPSPMPLINLGLLLHDRDRFTVLASPLQWTCLAPPRLDDSERIALRYFRRLHASHAGPCLF
jgi:uncharacterized Zn-binding protein involved in type VI secretion